MALFVAEILCLLSVLKMLARVHIIEGLYKEYGHFSGTKGTVGKSKERFD